MTSMLDGICCSCRSYTGNSRTGICSNPAARKALGVRKDPTGKKLRVKSIDGCTHWKEHSAFKTKRNNKK